MLRSHISHAGGRFSTHSSQNVLWLDANLGEPYVSISLSVGVCSLGVASGMEPVEETAPDAGGGAGDDADDALEPVSNVPLDFLSEWPKLRSGDTTSRMHCFNAFASGNPPSLRRSHTSTHSASADRFTSTWKVPGTNDGLSTIECTTASAALVALDVNVCSSSCWYHDARRSQLHLTQ